jgi:hypothetical protein
MLPDRRRARSHDRDLEVMVAIAADVARATLGDRPVPGRIVAQGMAG